MIVDDEVIAYLTASPLAAGLIMDFDGVLAPIVDAPGESRMLEGTAELLTDIAARLKVVAVLSGRELAFLRERVRVERVLLLGTYGLEELRDGVAHVHPEVSRWLTAVEVARAELHRMLDNVAGIQVEDKGISVGVHWRRAADQARAEDLVKQATTQLSLATGLLRAPGKLVIELRPPVPWTKGTAVQQLITREGLIRIGYAGDDLGDLPALQLVSRLGGRALVVEGGAETPPEVAACATRTFDGVEHFARWLGTLRQVLYSGTSRVRTLR